MGTKPMVFPLFLRDFIIEVNLFGDLIIFIYSTICHYEEQSNEAIYLSIFRLPRPHYVRARNDSNDSFYVFPRNFFGSAYSVINIRMGREKNVYMSLVCLLIFL